MGKLEKEIKILNVNKKEIEIKLQELGARKIEESMQQIYMYMTYHLYVLDFMTV